ncbi:MAG: hypothetical protein ACI87N_000449 [Flavobacteriales bacterium]|jgi:hypothetical protein
MINCLCLIKSIAIRSLSNPLGTVGTLSPSNVTKLYFINFEFKILCYAARFSSMSFLILLTSAGLGLKKPEAKKVLPGLIFT